MTRSEERALLAVLKSREVVKAITLTQPWATLLVAGVKRLEGEIEAAFERCQEGGQL